MIERLKLWLVSLMVWGMEEINEEVDDILADFHDKHARLLAVRDRHEAEGEEKNRLSHQLRLERDEHYANAQKAFNMSERIKQLIQ